MIKKLLKKYKCFKGVFPSDRLPYKSKLPLNIIINTDPSYKPGQHWIAVSITKEGVGEYFDSYGIPPFVESIEKFLNEKCLNGWTYNQVALQSINSETCGHYCILFIIFHCQNLTTDVMISKFNTNTFKNDQRMREIFKNFSFAHKA